VLQSGYHNAMDKAQSSPDTAASTGRGPDVFVLVHGTVLFKWIGSKSSTWIESSSFFCTTLSSELNSMRLLFRFIGLG
jgi:hypothetical protein